MESEFGEIKMDTKIQTDIKISKNRSDIFNLNMNNRESY